MKKLLFVVNPKAGKSVIKSDMINILEVFQKGGYEVTVYLTTENKKDNSDYIYEHATDYDLLVCAGGDGTLDNTVNGIMRLEREIKRRIHMGYIPCGSTNDYAKSLKLPVTPETATGLEKTSVSKLTLCRVTV